MEGDAEGIADDELVASRADGGDEGMDAGFVFIVSLFRRRGNVQPDSSLHRGVRVDDWIWKLFVLLRQEGFHGDAVRADDVAVEFLCLRDVRGDEERLHAVLHLSHAHAVHAVCVLCVGDRTGEKRGTKVDMDQDGGVRRCVGVFMGNPRPLS